MRCRDKWTRDSMWYYMLETASAEDLANLWHEIELIPGRDLTANLNDIEDMVLYRELVARYRKIERGFSSDGGFLDRASAAYISIARQGQPSPFFCAEPGFGSAAAYLKASQEVAKRMAERRAL